MNKNEQVIAELGMTIPEPAIPVANFIPYVITDKLVYISGQILLREVSVRRAP